MSKQEDKIIQRLQKIQSWADFNNFANRQEKDKGKIFTIFGKNGGRLISFYEKSIYKGRIYVYIADGTFPGDLEQRNIFVNELYKNNFIDNDYKRKDHKHFQKDKKLQDLTDYELEILLAILSKYCS